MQHIVYNFFQVHPTAGGGAAARSEQTLSVSWCPGAMLRAEIEENCETLIWITTGIFLISIFLSILRPDPTLAICLFGFYGAHTRSRGAVRAFWVYLLVSVLIDALWLYQYSALQPFTWQQMQQMTRREQVSAPRALPDSISVSSYLPK